jgi:hypothetical protein
MLHWTKFRKIDASYLNGYRSFPYVLKTDTLQNEWEFKIGSIINNGYYVPIKSIVKFMQIDLYYVENPGWAGACRTEGDRAMIWLNKHLTEPQQNYMMAIMLAYILHGPKDTEFRMIFCNFLWNENQKYCEFAIDLLVPEYLYNTLYSVQLSAPLIKIKDYIRAIWNKQVRQEIKNKKLWHQQNWFKQIADWLKIPEQVLGFVVDYRYNRKFRC